MEDKCEAPMKTPKTHDLDSDDIGKTTGFHCAPGWLSSGDSLVALAEVPPLHLAAEAGNSS